MAADEDARATTAAEGVAAPRSGPAELLAVASLLAVPWSVLTYGGRPSTLLFAWGLVNPRSLHVTDLYSYLFVFTRGVPDWILAWPVGAVCLLVAVASAGWGVAGGGEDVRVTGGLVALVGLAALLVSLGFAAQPGRLGVPVAAAVAWPLAGWYLLVVRRRRRDGR